jgi:Family of unknown function (DUF5723)
MKYLYRLKIFLFLPLALVFGDTLAQMEGTMPFMTSLPQVTYYNPAVKPAYKFSFGLPVMSSIAFQYTNNGFNYNDAVTRQGSDRVADLPKLYSALKSKNYINANFQVDLFRLSFKAGPRLYFTLNTTAKGYNRLMIPKDLFGLAIDGTEPYVNSTARLSPKVEALEYLEIGYGAAYTVNRKLTVGAKFKLLKGLANVTTKSAVFDLSLSDSYAMTITGDADIRTSGVHGLDDVDTDNWRDYTKNNGIAFDLGGTYQITDKILVGLSLIDIGTITWKNDLYGYSLDPSRASYTFDGVNIQNLIDGDAKYFDSISEDLEERFDFAEGTIAKYKTPLPGKVYLSGSYKLHRSFSVGALFFAERFRGRTMSGVTASVNKEFGRILSTAVSYTISNNSFNNIGAGFSLNLPPLQIYLVSDNLLRGAFALAQKDVNSFANNTNYLNLRTGINFVFGRDKTAEKLPHSKAIK